MMKEAPGNAIGMFGRLEVTAIAFFSTSHQKAVSIAVHLEAGLALIRAPVK